MVPTTLFHWLGSLMPVLELSGCADQALVAMPLHEKSLLLPTEISLIPIGVEKLGLLTPAR